VDWNAVKQELRGPAALVMAPFRADLSLDREALARNIRFMVDGGLRTGRGFLIVPCGTGEYVTLNHDEYRQMVEVAVDVVDGELPVVAGIASCDIREAITLAELACRAGARCVMCPPPYYYRLSEDAFVEWYRLLAEAVDVGLMIYDQSWRSELNATISLPAMERLVEVPNVVALKYGSPNLFMDMIDALTLYAERFAFIDNSLGYTATVSHVHGGAGFISGPATWWPAFELRFWELLEAGAYGEADRWHARIAPYMQYHRDEEFGGGSHYFGAALIKACLEYIGLYGGPVRPPFRALTAAQRDELYAVLDRIGVRSAVAA
jgi:dihydrodipicolinate synthase/N-acetylneuraminate lyase